ncbi:MAG: putative rane protein [Chthonomonadaceae bacterium]|nr:putative rane protein [Chthonomonadaceae bacterium]
MDTDLFFGHHIDPLSLGGKGAVLLLAVLLSGLIGLERQWHGNPAGLRTHILVCVGATILTMVSVEVGLGVRGGMRGDPGHIAAQIVSGIGFLGAGAILREGATVRGLTSAASIWSTAAIGMALGASPRLGELAVLTTVIVLITLTVVQRLEKLLKIAQPIQNLDIEVKETADSAGRVLELLCAQGFTIYGVTSSPGDASLSKSVMGATRLMRMRVLVPRAFDRAKFNLLLATTEGIVSFQMD